MKFMFLVCSMLIISYMYSVLPSSVVNVLAGVLNDGADSFMFVSAYVWKHVHVGTCTLHIDHDLVHCNI